MAHDPSWNLSKEEAKALSDAGAAVAQHYEVAVNPKTRDWLILLGVIGTLYGPRIAPMVFALFGKKKPMQKQMEKSESSVEMPFSNLPPIAGVPMTH